MLVQLVQKPPYSWWDMHQGYFPICDEIRTLV